MRNKLEHELIFSAGFGMVALCCATAIIALQQRSTDALTWLALSSLLWAFVWQQCWQRRAYNRVSDSAELFPTLGLANELSLFRGWLIAGTGGFLAITTPSPSLALIPALLYSIAAICDRLDGWMARRTQRPTQLGAALDTTYDALGLAVAPMLAVSYGKVPSAYLLVSAAYYAFVAGLAWRQRQHKPVFPLLPSTLRRTLAGMQMGFIAATLWPTMPAPLSQVASIIFMTPLLLGFAVDWLVVSGRIDATSKTAVLLYQRLPVIAARWLLPALRCLLLLCFWRWASSREFDVRTFSSSLSSFSSFSFVPFIAMLVSVVSIVLGCLAQLAATALLLLFALTFSSHPLTTDAMLVTIVAALILLLGSGKFSLWQYDQQWLERHDG
jgi:CDP-diacylglycerol---glycerol-3-phosphate 3-phosphatidyltransferase